MDETLVSRIEEIREALAEAEKAGHFLHKHAKSLAKLEPIANVLQSDPEQHEQLRHEYEQVKQLQQQSKQQSFALIEVAQRRAHFSYHDSTEMLSENTDLNNKLRKRLEQAEKERSQAREQLRQQQTKTAQFNQLLASLRSSYETKQDMLRELEAEIKAIGVQADSNAEKRARERRDQLYEAVNANRSRINQLEKQIAFCEAEMDNWQKKLRKLERDYYQLREQVVSGKSGGCAVCIWSEKTVSSVVYIGVN